VVKVIIILLLFSLGIKANPPVFDDKAAHWWVAFGLTVVSAEITWQITDRMDFSVCAGGLVGGGATVGKELIWDGYLNRGTKSLADGIAGGMGTATGMMVATVKFDLQRKKRKPIYKEYYN
jgi:hypothetical protein